MITPYTSARTFTDFSLRQSNLKYSCILTQNVATNLTVPGDEQVYKMVVRTNQTCWVAISSGNAVLPTLNTFVEINGEYVTVNNSSFFCREVKANEIVSFISSDTNTIVSVMFYSYVSNN